jgi:endonuclease/exonuclease/phosphatase family metal-dependent hydrolase
VGTLLKRIITILNIIAAFLLLLSYLAPLVDPSKFFLPALFGLIYPYLLVLNILFVIFWVIQLKWELLISLVVILTGWNHMTSLLPLNLYRVTIPGNIPGSQIFKVLSYNVRGFDMYQWTRDPETRNQIFSFVARQEPDIVCFQEYYTTSRRGATHEDIIRQLQFLPYNEVYYATDPANRKGLGIATFSRYPIIKRSRIPLNTTGNAAMYTDILFRSDTIRVFNIHLQSIRFRDEDYAFMDTVRLKYSDEQMRELRNIGSQLKIAFSLRARQADMISSYIKDSPHPVTVMGDFNDTPQSFAYRKIKKGMNDAFSRAGHGFGNTYAGELPSFRIDYILYSEPFRAYQFERFKNDYSDHFPITTWLYLPRASSPE